jgi:PD-(D/E)XK nuclease superfamily protein
MEPEHDLGPQNSGDGPLLRRVRLHQSWYRAAVLGLPRWGTTRARSPRQLGSVLCDQDAAAGLNFGSPEAFALYRARHAAGWGIDPRCSAYMTSSQALTINLFGLLSEDGAWFLECLNIWLGRSDLRAITACELEFAPVRRSLHLNDQTRVDTLIVVAGDHGSEVIAVEVKYADRFNSRHVDIATAPYRELASRSGLWTAPSWTLANRRVNQLARIHALATSYALSLGIAAPASLLVLTHELDTSAGRLIDDYQRCVNGPLVHRATIRSVCTSVVAAATARSRATAQDLHLRYGTESGSISLAKERQAARDLPASGGQGNR